jgi:hypothetical protein
MLHAGRALRAKVREAMLTIRSKTVEARAKFLTFARELRWAVAVTAVKQIDPA